MQAILNDVAHVLANLVVIFSADTESLVPKPIAVHDLIAGQFLNGARVFRTSCGEELRELSIQRREMTNAISILSSAHIRFQTPR